MEKINAVYGYGGFAREVMPIFNDQYTKERNVFVVHQKFMPKTKIINSNEILSFEDFIKIDNEQKSIVIAISDSLKRYNISNEIDKANIQRMNLISNKSIIMDSVEISSGAVICPFVTLTSNITIGDNFHANIYSYVAHDCVIGNNVTFAPSVKCNGNVIIEDNVYIGTGAIIKQGKEDNPIIIRENSIVAPGSYVTKNVEPDTTVYGNPAQKLSKSLLKK